MRSQMPGRKANWATQDGEILPGKLKREKAEMSEQGRKLDELRLAQAPG
jgi:hypothetical protein